MANYLIECHYCGLNWTTEYAPGKYTTCTRCNDRKNLTVKDISNSVDYYAGTTPYKDKDKTREVILQELPKEEEKNVEDEDYPFLIKTWD